MSRSNKSLKQESFIVTDTNLEQRAKIVRQSRIQLDPGKCTIRIFNATYDVVNITHFGFAIYLTAPEFEALQSAGTLNDSVVEGNLSYGEFELQTIHSKWVRTEKNVISDGQILGFEVIGEPIQLEKLLSIEKGSQVIKRQNDYVQFLNQIPPAFKAFTYEFRDLITELKNQIDELEEQSPHDSHRENFQYRHGIVEMVAKYLNHAIPAQYKLIPQMLEGLNKEQVGMCTKFIRDQIGHLVYGAPFAQRAYYKPRGYAGDYEMMNHLYRNEIVGKTLFDQCMHKYFIDEPAAEAVKNRGKYLLQKLTSFIANFGGPNKLLKILSVASGPAMEVQMLIADCKQFHGWPIEFQFIDQDEESLIHAQKQITTLDRFAKTGFKFVFRNLAIKNIIVHGLPEQKYNLIYTAGLFDYFTDPVATTAALKLYEGLSDGGELIIGNYSTHNPTVALMDFVLDWHLIYRSEDDLRRIFEKVGKSLEIEQEPLQINYFAVIR